MKALTTSWAFFISAIKTIGAFMISDAKLRELEKLEEAVVQKMDSRAIFSFGRRLRSLTLSQISPRKNVVCSCGYGRT